MILTQYFKMEENKKIQRKKLNILKIGNLLKEHLVMVNGGQVFLINQILQLKMHKMLLVRVDLLL